MARRDMIHKTVKEALVKDGWNITDDPYVIAYGERFLFVDLGAEEALYADEISGAFIGIERDGVQIAVEIKALRGRSVIVDLEQAIGQYTLYRLLLNRVDPTRVLFLAIPDKVYKEIFNEPIGEVVINDLPLNLIVVDIEKVEVKRWIPNRPIK